MEVEVGGILEIDSLVQGVVILVDRHAPGLHIGDTVSDNSVHLIVVHIVVHRHPGRSQGRRTTGVLMAGGCTGGTGHINQVVIAVEGVAAGVGVVDTVLGSTTTDIEGVVTPIHVAHVTIVETVVGGAVLNDNLVVPDPGQLRADTVVVDRLTHIHTVVGTRTVAPDAVALQGVNALVGGHVTKTETVIAAGIVGIVNVVVTGCQNVVHRIGSEITGHVGIQQVAAVHNHVTVGRAACTGINHVHIIVTATDVALHQLEVLNQLCAAGITLDSVVGGVGGAQYGIDVAVIEMGILNNSPENHAILRGYRITDGHM